MDESEVGLEADNLQPRWKLLKVGPMQRFWDVS